VNFENKKFQDALEYCQDNQDGTLASIHSEAENKHIMGLFSNSKNKRKKNL
jgi:hypothetical protein